MTKSKAPKRHKKGGVDVISGQAAPLRQKPDAERVEPEVPAAEQELVLDQGESLTSVSNLLVQGLRSRNAAMIEQALGQSDGEVIIESIEKIPASVSFLLLEALVQRIVKTPNRAPTLCPWLRCLNLVHGDYVSSLSNYQKVIRPLQELVAMYTDSFKQLLQLRAQVQFLMARDTYEATKSSRQSHPSEPNENVIIYNEDSEDLMESIKTSSRPVDSSSESEADIVTFAGNMNEDGEEEQSQEESESEEEEVEDDD